MNSKKFLPNIKKRSIIELTFFFFMEYTTPRSSKLIPISILLYGIIHTGLYFIMIESLKESFLMANEAIPSIRMYGQGTAERILDLVNSYGLYTGAMIMGIFLILTLIVWLIFKILGITKSRLGAPLILLFSIVPLLLLGMDMAFFTTGYTALINGIIFFIGTPLFYSSCIMTFIALVFLFKPAPKQLSMILIMASSLTLSGCVWDQYLLSASCPITGDTSHCYQQAAVQTGDPGDCEKVSAPAEFAKAGSNPPRDKCLDMTAQNTNTPETCEKIQGGIGSYSKEDCIKNVATSNANAEACTLLPNGMPSCINAAAESLNKEVNNMIQKWDKLKEKDQLELQKKMSDMQKYYEMLNNINKAQFDSSMTAIKNIGR